MTLTVPETLPCDPCYKRLIFKIFAGAGSCAPLESNVKLRGVNFYLSCALVTFGVIFSRPIAAQNLTLEGQTGGFITPTAYVVYGEKGNVVFASSHRPITSSTQTR